MTVPITILEVVVLASVCLYLGLDPFITLTQLSGCSKIIADFIMLMILIRLLSIGLPIYLATMCIAFWAVVTICILHFTHEVSG